MSKIDYSNIKQRILPYFIEIYGEEFRDLIIAKMNQIEPIFYSTIEGKKSEMYTIQSAKRVELTLKFLEYNGIEIPEEIKSKMINDNNTWALSDIPEAQNLLKACFCSNQYREMVWGGIKDIPRQPTDRIIEKDILYRAIKADRLGSIVLYGPLEVGKTTIA